MTAENTTQLNKNTGERTQHEHNINTKHKQHTQTTENICDGGEHSIQHKAHREHKQDENTTKTQKHKHTHTHTEYICDGGAHNKDSKGIPKELKDPLALAVKFVGEKKMVKTQTQQTHKHSQTLIHPHKHKTEKQTTKQTNKQSFS